MNKILEQIAKNVGASVDKSIAGVSIIEQPVIIFNEHMLEGYTRMLITKAVNACLREKRNGRLHDLAIEEAVLKQFSISTL